MTYERIEEKTAGLLGLFRFGRLKGGEGEVVGTTAPVALEVEGDVLVAEAFEFFGNASGGGRIEEAREFGGTDLDAGKGGAHGDRRGMREIVEVRRG